jgi:hypothetical protein
MTLHVFRIRDSSAGVETRLDPGIEVRFPAEERELYPQCPDCLESPIRGSIPRGMKLTTHLHTVLRLRMCPYILSSFSVYITSLSAMTV